MSHGRRKHSPAFNANVALKAVPTEGAAGVFGNRQERQDSH